MSSVRLNGKTQNVSAQKTTPLSAKPEAAAKPGNVSGRSRRWDGSASRDTGGFRRSDQHLATTASKGWAFQMRILSIAAALLAIAAMVGACAPDQATTAPGEQDATTAPAPTEQAADPDPGLSTAQQNAIESAESYLDFSAFSQSGLIDQLAFEGYSTADATFAVESLDVDWNEQAAKSAASYLEMTSFSLSGLIDQLVFEGFTPEQAAYGANQAYGQ